MAREWSQPGTSTKGTSSRLVSERTEICLLRSEVHVDSYAGQEPACADKLVASKTVRQEQAHHSTTERSKSNLFLALAKFQLPVLLLTRVVEPLSTTAARDTALNY